MKYLALVIGNSKYENSEMLLNNGTNDGNAMAEKLETLAFDVIRCMDGNRTAFGDALAEFTTRLKNYDVGVFYFAGHAFQMNGKNYLTPIDTDFSDEQKAKYYSYDLSGILEDMQIAGTTMKIVILDACRNNPYKSRGGGNLGLATVFAPKGTLIAFSTSPGETAKDGAPGGNSVYTGALLAHINDQNIPVEELFKRVRTSVFSDTNGKQTPWEHTSLIGEFYFNSGQRIQSLQLPYIPKVIKDKLYVFSNSLIDRSIEKLKDYNYDTQNGAFRSLDLRQVKLADPNMQFLLGRNLLQAAEGGAFALQGLFEEQLESWLSRFNQENMNNHILNGILFEIYFNGEGEFRKKYFKTRFLDEIYMLQDTGKFDGAFRFIREQLVPYRDNLFYIPQIPPVSLAFNLSLEKEKLIVGSQRKEVDAFRLIKISFNGEEIYQSDGEPDDFDERQKLLDIKEKIQKNCMVPKFRLTLTNNLGRQLDDDDIILVSYDFDSVLARKKRKA